MKKFIFLMLIASNAVFGFGQLLMDHIGQEYIKNTREIQSNPYHSNTYLNSGYNNNSLNSKSKGTYHSANGKDGFIVLTLPAGVFGGSKNYITDGIGFYGGLNYSNDYSTLNVGLTLDFINDITLLGGIGSSTEEKEDSHGNKIDTESKTNYNMVIMYNFSDKFGVTIGYDTVPSSINCGLSMYF